MIAAKCEVCDNYINTCICQFRNRFNVLPKEKIILNQDLKDRLQILKLEIDIYNRNCVEGFEITAEDIINHFNSLNKK